MPFLDNDEGDVDIPGCVGRYEEVIRPCVWIGVRDCVDAVRKRVGDYLRRDVRFREIGWQR